MEAVNNLIIFPRDRDGHIGKNSSVEHFNVVATVKDIPEFIDINALNRRGIDVYLPTTKNLQSDGGKEKQSSNSIIELSDSDEELEMCHGKAVHPESGLEYTRIFADLSYKKTKQKCDCATCSRGNTRGKKLGHLCGICNKTYKKTSHYRYHQMLHSNERLSCNYCEKLFHRPDMFKRHIRIHLGQKDYECGICNKQFFRSDHLKKHVKTHNKDKDTQ